MERLSRVLSLGLGAGALVLTCLTGSSAAEAAAPTCHGKRATIVGSDKVRGTNGPDVIVLEPNALATIPIGEKVRLDNPESESGHLLMIFSPPEFVSKLASWPLVDAGRAGDLDLREQAPVAVS